MKKYLVAGISGLIGIALIGLGLWTDRVISRPDLAPGNFNSGSRFGGGVSAFGILFLAFAILIVLPPDWITKRRKR